MCAQVFHDAALRAVVVLFAILTVACRPDTARVASEGHATPSTDDSAERVRRATARPRIVVLGDSLTAGLGLAPEQAFPAVLQHRLDQAGLQYEVVNAGVSGDTTAGGLRRLDWALDGDVRVLVLALGSNDGIRGLGIGQMKENLATIIARARAREVRVLLCGMEAPPNLGPAYTTAFREAFARLAAEEQVRFVPFLLDGVAGASAFNQADGIHPNAQGARRVADTVWHGLEPMLRTNDAP